MRFSSTRSTVPIGAPSAPMTFICSRIWSKAVIGLSPVVRPLNAAIASSGQACFVIIGDPFVDGVLFGADPSGGREIGGARGVCGGAIIGDGLGRRRPLMAVQLLKLAALLVPVPGLGLLEQQQRNQ